MSEAHTLQTEDLYRLKAYQDSASADSKVRRGYFDWLCPTPQEKARLTAQYLELNPNDTEGVSAMMCSLSDTDELDIEPTTKIDEEIYHFDPLLVFYYIAEIGKDLADIFKKSLMNIRDIINMSREKKQQQIQEEQEFAPAPEKEHYHLAKQQIRAKYKEKKKVRESTLQSGMEGYEKKLDRDEMLSRAAKQKAYQDKLLERYEQSLRERRNAQRTFESQEHEREVSLSMN